MSAPTEIDGAWEIAVLAWAVTYLVHSSLLIVFATVVNAVVRSEVWRDALWKTALVGGVLTATLSTVLDGTLSRTPLSGRWSAPVVLAASPDSRGNREALSHARDAAPPSARGTQTINTRPPELATWLVAAWAMVATALIGRVVWRHRLLLAELGTREPVRDSTLLEALARLRRRAGVWHEVRLTVSRACPTPVVLNAREICVPDRFIRALRPEQQQAALAHELAHIARRDPLWQRLAAVMQAVFFFQLLNRVACVRLRECAEYLCDDWAARHTGEPMGLASCLTDVAGWIGSAVVPRATLAMSEAGASLLQRIERLTSWRPEPVRSGAPRVFAMLSLMGGVTGMAPLIVAPPATRSQPADRSSLTLSPMRTSCAFTGSDSLQIDTTGVRRVYVEVPAGEVEINGSSGPATISARGQRCASSSELLDGLELRTRRAGEELRIQVVQPTQLFRRTQASTANLNLQLALPSGLAVTMTGGSGNVVLRNVGGIRVRGGMGRYDISNVGGSIDLQPKLGDLLIENIRGDVRVGPTVGDVNVQLVSGNVMIAAGHTGPIQARDVRGTLRVPKGHAGDIVASDIGGDLVVGQLAEGRVRYERIRGRVRLDSVSVARTP